MKINLHIASVMIDNLSLALVRGRIDPSQVTVIPLKSPYMEVVKTLNGRNVKLLLSEIEQFPDPEAEDFAALKASVVNSWPIVATRIQNNPTQAVSMTELAIQDFLNVYYEEEIEATITEVNLNEVVPVEIPEIDEGTVVFRTVAALNSMFLTPTGNLLVGTGIPGSKYSIAANDFIELGLTSFRRSKWDEGRVMSGNTSVLTLATTTEAWNVTWSVGSTHPEITDITQMYDVEFIMYANGNGLKQNALTWSLIRDEATVSKYALRLDTNVGGPVPNVVDSRGDAAQRCAQNSTQLAWFRPAVVPPIAAPSAITGTYVAELRATHKITGRVISVEHITTVNLPS